MTLLICSWVFTYRSFLIFSQNFGRIVFQAALFDCFFRWDVFHSEMKHLYEKYCPSHAGIPLWTSRVPVSRGGIRNVMASCQRNNKLLKTRLSSHDLVYCPVPLFIPSRLSHKQPLSGFDITKEEFAIAYKYEKTIKASAYVYWKRTWNERKAAVLSYFLKELEKIVYNRIINTLIKKNYCSTYFMQLVCFYTLESIRFSIVFTGYRKKPVVRNWLQNMNLGDRFLQTMH